MDGYTAKELAVLLAVMQHAVATRISLRALIHGCEKSIELPGLTDDEKAEILGIRNHSRDVVSAINELERALDTYGD